MLRFWFRRMTISITNGSNGQRRNYTITGLKRWSCQTSQLPSVAHVKAIHVYDFDNTLFMSPLPNPKLWTQPTIGRLQNEEGFGSGGWWHDERILAATGTGLEQEEPKAWKGWWNEQVVELVKLSMEQEDALTVLLTGRAESNFADLIKRIVSSKTLSFDMICLKPEAGPNNQRFNSTMNFKQVLLEDLVYTYKDANEIKVYEDRPKHTIAFRDFFKIFNTDLQYMPNPPRKPLTADVVQVTDQSTTLDPVVETAEVQRLLNAHNTAVPPPARNLEIKKTVSYTGYLISATDTPRLLGLVNNAPGMSNGNIKFLANNVLISFGPAQPPILSKVGGMGHKQDWQVTALGVWQNSVWAAKVSPIPPVSIVHTDTSTPLVILAQKNTTPLSHANRISHWQPVPPDKSYIIQTTVGEKAQLRVEYESEESEYDSLFDRNDRKNLKRPHSPSKVPNLRGGQGNDENKRTGQGNQARGGRGGGSSANRGGNSNTNNRNNRRGQGGGNIRGGGGGNRRSGGGGGGGQRGYKSLDDMGTTGGARYQRGDPSYDDYVPPGVGGYNQAFPGNGGVDGAGDGGGMNY